MGECKGGGGVGGFVEATCVPNYAATVAAKFAGLNGGLKETTNEGQRTPAPLPILTRLRTRVAVAHTHAGAQPPRSPPPFETLPAHVFLPSPDSLRGRLVKTMTSAVVFADTSLGSCPFLSKYIIR